MSGADWADVRAALAAVADQGGVTRFWLRDDDAVAVTPALERLSALCGAAGMPILLAVIPEGATADLAEWAAARPDIIPCQHGWAHINWAKAGDRACELGGERSDDVVLAELAQGRERMQALFGPRAAATLVPPWNRIRASLVPQLARMGYRTLSTFRDPNRPPDGTLARLDCDLDIIDWRDGRRGRNIEDLCGRLVRLIAGAGPSGGTIGLLTHHLAHDQAAWSFLSDFLAEILPDRDVRFVAAPEATTPA